MHYNWKCCSFYPNNFGASALTCPLSRRPLACGRVSTGQCTCFHWPAYVFSLACGNISTGQWTITECTLFNGYMWFNDYS